MFLDANWTAKAAYQLSVTDFGRDMSESAALVHSRDRFLSQAQNGCSIALGQGSSNIWIS